MKGSSNSAKQRAGDPPASSAFSLTELLVVIAILALLAATQLPALTRAKAPVKFTQCMNNLRQIGQATLLYKDDNNDAFPFGSQASGSGNSYGIVSVIDPTGWPMQLLRYMGGYRTNVQPMVYICPSEKTTAPDWAFQVHYAANRYLLRDIQSADNPLLAASVRKPAIYWMFIEKAPDRPCNTRSSALYNPSLLYWNFPPGFPENRRHNDGMSSAAADGHVEWLRTPPYQPGAPAPKNFLELGDCASGSNPATTWHDTTTPGNDNGYRVKLYGRFSYIDSQTSF